ncbi:rho GTPase-activating protein 6 [Lampris incognitus]|uniref:rho GTPase-activating protein 6 n=1 Tax=Lampris incognitus TaxID=2546036 RepID=UPI0024B6087F|nr:rho GTPase-activating protein 6 [Lampris incognitus]
MGAPMLDRRIAYLGDFTWNSVSGRSVGLKPVPLQSLSELERVRLQDVAYSRLLQDFDLGCQITIPKDGQKRKKSLRRKLDSFSKEKSKDKETAPQTFGIPLSQVISNGRRHKQRQDPVQEEQRDPGDLMLSFLHLASNSKRANKELSSSNSSLSSTSETTNGSPLPNTPEAAPRTRRRGGVSVDCITDLDDNESRLLEALQLSLPAEAPGNRNKHRDKKLSLNPIYRQVPRVVDSCCQHLEKYGLQTVGIFRVGSSKKRVRQLREEFDQGMEVQLDAELSVHDVAALLKEFLRDMPDPLLTRELYTAFVNAMLLDCSDQDSATQLLIYLLPPCNSDTLQRLLHFLSTVAAHAEDSVDREGQEITGNKMTSLNLATIFGPNLLHKLKNSDKEFAVQSFARAEESTAIISVVQKMITAHDTLFMVPADLQNEVLMSLLETDPDVVDYLLRRKASQYSGSGPLRTEESFSMSERHSSSDSNKASSGEVSPYDNNSPLLPERLLCTCQGGVSPFSDCLFTFPRQRTASGRPRHAPASTGPTPSAGKGSHGDVSECESYDSSEGLDGLRGNSKLPVRTTRASLGVPEPRPHLPVTRCSSGPHDQRGPGQPEPLSHQRLRGHSEAASSEDLAVRTGSSPVLALKGGTGGKTVDRCLFRETHISHSSPSLSTYQSNTPAPGAASSVAQPGAEEPMVTGASEWQREKWHMWQLLSTDNADSLPETLV